MELTVQGGTATLTFDILTPAKAPKSASGKNKVLATTHGFTVINGYRVNLTVLPEKGG